MKNFILFSSVLLLLAACNHHQLKITDLKFGDFEREQIVKNRVDTMYILANNDLNLISADTIGYETFDAAGDLLSQKQLINQHNVAICDYDSVGLLKHKTYDTNFKGQYDLSYKFDSNTQLLYQVWAGKAKDTSLFKFDAKGNLLEAIDCGDVDSGREFHYKTIYVYNSAGLLVQKKRDLLVPTELLSFLEKDLGTVICDEDTTDYYYEHNRLTTSVTTFNYPNEPKLNYSSKTYYNDKGLREITVSNGHVVTRYAYSSRELDDKDELFISN